MTKPASSLTEAQLYNEANALIWIGRQRTDAQNARLAKLEDEFARRHAAALAA